MNPRRRNGKKPTRPRMVMVRRKHPHNRKSAYGFIPRRYRHAKDARWADDCERWWSATLYETEYGALCRHYNPKGDTPPRHVRFRNGPDKVVPEVRDYEDLQCFNEEV